MEIKDYREIIQKTAIYPNKVNNFGLAYCWLGLIGETQEFIKEATNSDQFENNIININNLKKKLGDVIWYTTAIANILELDLDRILYPNCFYYETIDNICTYCEAIKKYYRDNTELDKVYIENILSNNIHSIIGNKRNLNIINVEDIPEIMKINYEKLIKRRETNTLSGSGSNREEEVK